MPAGLSNIVAIAAGGFHSLALRSDGTVVSWGLYDQSTVPLDLTDVFDEIVPHLTIAQGDDSLLDAIEAELAEELPLETRVERVWLVENTPTGWSRHTGFALERRKSV